MPTASNFRWRVRWCGCGMQKSMPPIAPRAKPRKGKIYHIDREISFEGNLDAATRARLLEIADKCPVHRTLTSEVDICTVEKPATD